MQCRYCGKELALLKRLTGGGGFCSDAHKQSYQDEYNQLALSRLLQAQKTGHTESSGKKTLNPVDVEEPAAQEPPVEKGSAQALSTELAALEVSNLASDPEEHTTGDSPGARDSEPTEIADFLIDSPGLAALPEEAPRLESWQEFSAGPAVANWQFQDGVPALSTAAPMAFDIAPNASRAEDGVVTGSFKPQEFAKNNGPSPPWKVAISHQLPSAGPISIEMQARSIDFAVDRSLAGELGFETAGLVNYSKLLELRATGIEFPAEDSDVVVVFGQDRQPDNQVYSAEPEPAQDDTPRASLEALSRLHQDLLQQAEGGVEDSQAETPTPGRATELVEIAIRTCPPAKPIAMAGAGLPSEAEPLLPHLKSLPLRPKMAVAHGYVPPSITPAQPKAATNAPPAVFPAAPPAAVPDTRPIATAKPAPAARPVARIIQPKQQPKQPAVQAKPPETSKPAASFEPAAQAVAAKITPPAPARPETEAVAKPAAMQSPLPPVKKTLGEPAPEPMPNFGAVQLANPSFAGSLKVKLGIAITFLVVACSFWLGWGGKAHRSSAANSAISADGSGPSIILGEGGWVENWGGDPSGVHAGREITIYRPSLKLSDYRIEFQASIDTKSIGWVFRAADPDNYYAMKLMAVSSGLSAKVALFKYLVISGRQTQVGRVPIDQTVQADTVFHVQTDVRGPQFSTYIQGRLVDVWTDDQLKAGGVGFLNEREERGKVKSVSIRYLNGAAK